jgi:2-polyprenyl-6-methoxyphenol hydroxylase-like FAD-dependent oxidoreductase
MHLSDLHVIVVGGATGGAAAALLLARRGARVTLVERVASPRAAGAGIALAENGIAVLDSLGLGPALAAAREVRGVRVTDAAGRTLLAPPSPAPRVAMLRRATLQGVLLDALAAEPHVERHFGVEVLRAEPDGTVWLRHADGAARAVSADLVVGADGVHSRVRAGGAFGARVRGTGIRYVRGLVADGLAEGAEAWTPAGIFGSFAVDGGTYFFASCGTRACAAALAARDLGALRAAWARAYAPAARILGAVPGFDALLVHEVLRVDCARWWDGRLALLGDAAHAMAPNLGQGANSALVDAAVLLDELRRAPTLDAALAAYDARRRPAVRRVADTAARLGRLAEATHPVARAVRDRVLLPVAGLLTTARTTAAVLQEPSHVLRAIGDAGPAAGGTSRAPRPLAAGAG